MEELSRHSCWATSGVTVSSRWSTRTFTSSGKKGLSLLLQRRSPASHTNLRAEATSGPYRRGRPRRLPGGPGPRPSSRMAAFRWYPVTRLNSSRISPFSLRLAIIYRFLTASPYSSTLPRVMLPPGNIISEATILLSVTFIMSQFGLLTFAAGVGTILGEEVGPWSR